MGMGQMRTDSKRRMSVSSLIQEAFHGTWHIGNTVSLKTDTIAMMVLVLATVQFSNKQHAAIFLLILKISLGMAACTWYDNYHNRAPCPNVG